MTADQFNLYIDGILDVTSNGPDAGKSYSGVPWIGVGNNPCDSSLDRLWFQGSIDDIRFYDGLLAPAEIEALAMACP